MPSRIPYADKKPAIRAELERRARERDTITYGELGSIVGIPSRGPWKAVLDDMAREDMAAGVPDITYLVIAKRTGLPGQIDFEPAAPPTDEQRRKADDVIKRVFAHFAQG